MAETSIDETCRRAIEKIDAGDFDGALAAFDRTLDPQNVRAWCLRAIARHGSGDLSGAAADLRRAVEVLGNGAVSAAGKSGGKGSDEKETQQMRLLESRLMASFEDMPFEDCISHAAEKIIAEALQQGHKAAVLEFFRDTCLDANRDDLASSVLRCLARQEGVGTAEWRAGLVRSGLASDSLLIRDAAVAAAEEWGDPEMRGILEQHSEPVSWLADYIRKAAAYL